MSRTLVPVSTRVAVAADDMALRTIFRTIRADALSALGWPVASIDAFCSQQYELQQAHYRRAYDPLDHRVVLDAGAVIGQIALHHGPDALTLVDLSLLPSHRGRGVGTNLISHAIDVADRRGHPMILSVAHDNTRAAVLYRRLGFDTVSSTELHLHMRREPTGKEPE